MSRVLRPRPLSARMSCAAAAAARRSASCASSRVVCISPSWRSSANGRWIVSVTVSALRRLNLLDQELTDAALRRLKRAALRVTAPHAANRGDPPRLAGTGLDDPGVGFAPFSSRRPQVSTFSTTASTSSVFSTTLLPPPRMNLGAKPYSGWSTTRRTSASLLTRTRVLAKRWQAEAVVLAQAGALLHVEGRRSLDSHGNSQAYSSECPASTPSSSPTWSNCATRSTRRARKLPPVSTSRAAAPPSSWPVPRPSSAS